MSFTGDLAQLPIVDVIQLMNSTRKSGILGVHGRKGKSELVFKDGYIVSANHLNNSVRIGEVLLQQGAVTEEGIQKALEAQKSANPKERKPFVVTLLELGLVEEAAAYKGLQALIELTIVEMLTWRNGAFSLQANLSNTPDNYKFYPQSIEHEINIDTQGVLMDALRVFDEKLRDGQINLESDEEPEEELSADDLGLDGLDDLDTRSPDVFTVLDDRKLQAVEEQSQEEEIVDIELELEDEPVDFETAPTPAAPTPAAPTPAAPTSAAPLQGAARAAAVEAIRKSAVGDNPIRRRNQMIVSLYSMRQPQEVALGVLNFVAELMPRGVILVLKNGEAVAERARLTRGEEDPTGPLGYAVPLDGSTQLQEVVDTGRAYMGELRDSMLKQYLLSKIGAPVADIALLLPVRNNNKTVFVIYADYGSLAAGNVSKGLLEMVAEEAGHVLEKIMARF